jgi:anti-sigma factor RsiW
VAEIAAGCRAFDEDLSALLDGELGAERRAEVEAHVAGCPGCAARLAELHAVDGALTALPAPAVAPDLGARLEHRLQQERYFESHRKRFRRISVPALVLPLAAAAALVLYLALRVPAPTQAPVEPIPVAKAPVAPDPAPQVARREPAAPPSEAAAEPAPQVAGAEPAPAADELDALDAEDLAVLLELETIEDLPVIANLEVLERLLREEAG